MDWKTTRARFAFLASAFDGTDGFAPKVSWTEVPITNDQGQVTSRVCTPSLSGPTELVRYPREGDAKFAQRNAVAVYENHLRSACKRYVGYLGRKEPQREGIDAPLVKLMVENADLRGTSLNSFWSAFALDAKARGSMLLVIDMPTGEPATSLADQMQRRRVPYIRSARPEDLLAYRIDADSGLLVNATLAAEEWWGDELIAVERDYTTTGWRVRKGNSQTVLAEGLHAFGACPVLAFTENGREFPQVGEFAQIADLSKRLFNARSERDEILRSQTFSLLTLQVPAEQAATFNAAEVGATIGTHSMLVHSGDTPSFIAADSGPAATYAKNIEELEASIRRISMETSSESADQPESGVARRLRFEALNSDLATFAKELQQLEMRVWAMFTRAMKSGAGVSCTWPTDFNLADVLAELDILTGMQMAGFPPLVLNEKRKSIAAAEFDAADADLKSKIEQAIDEYEQEATPPSTGGGDEDA